MKEYADPHGNTINIPETLSELPDYITQVIIDSGIAHAVNLAHQDTKPDIDKKYYQAVYNQAILEILTQHLPENT